MDDATRSLQERMVHTGKGETTGDIIAEMFGYYQRLRTDGTSEREAQAIVCAQIPSEKEDELLTLIRVYEETTPPSYLAPANVLPEDPADNG